MRIEMRWRGGMVGLRGWGDGRVRMDVAQGDGINVHARCSSPLKRASAWSAMVHHRAGNVGNVCLI